MDKKAKVIVVAPRFPAINQPWIDTYLEQLLKNNFDVTIYSENYSNDIYGEKVDTLNLTDRVVRFPFERKNLITPAIVSLIRPWRIMKSVEISKAISSDTKSFIKNIFYALKFFSKIESFKDASIIHSHSEGLTYKFLILSKILDIPIIQTFHGLPPMGVKQLNEKKREILYKNVSRVLVNTSFSSEQVQQLGCDKKIITIIPQGLPLSEFPFSPMPKPSPEGGLNVITVGRFHRDKGQGYAIGALKRLMSSGVNIKWTFIGVGPDIDRLKGLAMRLGVSSRTSFISGLSSKKLVEKYSSNHVLVLPSISSKEGHVETQGVVIQEAQATGCLAVVSRTGGIPECVNEGDDAILFRQRSSRDIAESICRLMTEEFPWEEFQNKARLNVEENFSADVIGERMATIIMKLIED